MTDSAAVGNAMKAMNADSIKQQLAIAKENKEMSVAQAWIQAAMDAAKKIRT